MSFLYNSLTRKNIVQAVYSMRFLDNFNLNDFLLDKDFFFDIKNEPLFIEVISKVDGLKYDFKGIFGFLGFDFEFYSAISIAIIKAFIAEFFLQKFDVKILFKEYLSLLNAFCFYEASDIKIIMNKCVDLNLLSFDQKC